MGERKSMETAKREGEAIEPSSVPDFGETNAGQRLKAIADELQRRVTKETKRALIDHRSKLPAVFKDEDLWRKKEAWVIAGMCLHLVITGHAVKLIESEASIVDWQNAHRFFWNRTAQESVVYLPALADSQTSFRLPILFTIADRGRIHCRATRILGSERMVSCPSMER